MNNEAETLSLEEKFKAHIHFEEGMDDSMLSFYLNMAKKLCKNCNWRARRIFNFDGCWYCL